MRALVEGDLYFYDPTELQKEVCPACDRGAVLVASYPYSHAPQFAALLTCWCRTCGFGWVPVVPFDLNEYYQTAYSKNRGDRELAPKDYFALLDGPLDTIPNNFRQYVARARSQHARINNYVDRGYALIELGSGPGYGLYFSQATQKAAVEPDDASGKYLEYLGAKRLSLDALPSDTYDVVLASHSVEHLTVEALYPTLQRLREALKPGGIIYVEVPNGAHTGAFIPGSHAPHTLFFSLASLKSVVTRSGFEVVETTYQLADRAARLQYPIHGEEVLEQPPDAQSVTVVARKARSESIPTIGSRPTALRASRAGPGRAGE